MIYIQCSHNNKILSPVQSQLDPITQNQNNQNYVTMINTEVKGQSAVNYKAGEIVQHEGHIFNI